MSAGSSPETAAAETGGPAVAVITGGSRCIRAPTAPLLARRGWAVCIGYVSQADAAGAVVDQLGGSAVVVPVDVGWPEASYVTGALIDVSGGR